VVANCGLATKYCVELPHFTASEAFEVAKWGNSTGQEILWPAKGGNLVTLFAHYSRIEGRPRSRLAALCGQVDLVQHVAVVAGDFVVQRARLGVGILRLPIHRVRASGSGNVGNGGDKGASHSKAANVGGGE
jgi:hypothetical protein